MICSIQQDHVTEILLSDLNNNLRYLIRQKEYNEKNINGKWDEVVATMQHIHIL